MNPRTFLNSIVAIVVFLNFGNVYGQSEYRISDDAKYEYLSVRQEAGMVYDESMGTYYKPITVRTFFLETQRKGYLPADLTYSSFLKLSVKEQRNMVKQPYKDIQCSVDNPSEECTVPEEAAKAKVPALRNDPVYCKQGGYGPECKIVDLSPKCDVADMNKSAKSPSLTTQMITNPTGEVENIDCGDAAQKAEQSKAEDKSKSAPSTVKVLLDRE